MASKRWDSLHAFACFAPDTAAAWQVRSQAHGSSMVHEVAALFKGFPQQPMRTFRALYAGCPTAAAASVRCCQQSCVQHCIGGGLRSVRNSLDGGSLMLSPRKAVTRLGIVFTATQAFAAD